MYRDAQAVADGERPFRFGVGDEPRAAVGVGAEIEPRDVRGELVVEAGCVVKVVIVGPAGTRPPDDAVGKEHPSIITRSCFSDCCRGYLRLQFG